MMKRYSCAGEFGTTTGSSLPSQEVMERNDASAKVVRLREARYRFEAQLRELQRARELSDAVLSAVDELNGEE
jgi:hypothetical protein